METVILRAEDFKTVHNTLCELRGVEQMLNEVISDSLAAKLHSVIKGFEQGLANAYEQERALFNTKNDHYEAIKSQLDLRSIWSIYEVEDLNQPHPFGDALQIIYEDHWGDGPVVADITGPRWVDLYAAADAAIQCSGDRHHIFIEALNPVAGQPHQLKLTTGS